MDNLVLREGTSADYRSLAGFHYLSQAPVTATRVLVIEDTSPTVQQRWRNLCIARGQPAEGPRPATSDASASGAARIVAVLIESLPALSCALRNVALPGRYTGFDRRSAARLLNDEVRCISRVVVHPQFRGLGLAVRLVRHALDTAATPYTEALAAMGRVHPFFRLAGMTEYHRPPHAKDQRLLDAMRSVGIAPWELASPNRLRERLAADAVPDIASHHAAGRESGGGSGREVIMNDRRLTIMNRADTAAATRLGGVASRVFRRELARWAGRGMRFEQQLQHAGRRLLAEPVYYLHANPARPDSSPPSPAAPPIGPPRPPHQSPASQPLERVADFPAACRPTRDVHSRRVRRGTLARRKIAEGAKAQRREEQIKIECRASVIFVQRFWSITILPLCLRALCDGWSERKTVGGRYSRELL